MGYQLWMSPITGYRRKGTRLSELRSALGIGVTANTIFEPLQSCLSDAPAHEIALLLEKRGFDVVGVQFAPKGPVVGFVTAKSLRDGIIRNYTEPLHAEHLVSEATPLGQLLSLLRSKERVFVLVGAEVKGIITLADLNKPSVRVYLFRLLSLLEMHLRFWVFTTYGPNGWQEMLNGERLVAANTLHAERRKRNEEITLLDCLQFCDKRDLVITNADLRAKLGLGSKSSSASLFRRAEELRNNLAHSQQDLVQGRSWPELIEVAERLEAVVHCSDDAIEEMAKASGKGINGLLVAV
jgi:hypothetical protein